MGTDKIGFIVIEMEKQHNFIVRDMSQVAKLLGIDFRTVRGWFTGNNRVYVYKTWLVAKDYQVMVSQRGKRELT